MLLIFQFYPITRLLKCLHMLLFLSGALWYIVKPYFKPEHLKKEIEDTKTIIQKGKMAYIMSDLWFWLMSSPILRFCSSMRELFSNTSFFRHSFSWINDVHWVLRTVNEGSIDRSLRITCMILWMLCMIMAVSMDMFDKPNETLPCFCRSSI